MPERMLNYISKKPSTARSTEGEIVVLIIPSETQFLLNSIGLGTRKNKYIYIDISNNQYMTVSRRMRVQRFGRG